MRLDSFIPHGFCLAWDPGLVALQAASDLLIALAYFSIPAALVVFLRRRKDLAFRPVFGLFAAFIMACGTTHVLGVVTLYYPVYWLDGGVKAVTAALSIATAIVLWPLLPKAVALPSPSVLSALNAQLAREVEERDATAARLRASEQRLRELYSHSPAILHATDADGVLIEVSQRWLDLFGYSRREVIGRPVIDFYEPGTEFLPSAQFAAAEASQAKYERRIVLASGEIRDAEATFTIERDGTGRVQGILVALTDVTPRKQAEAALQDSEERLRHAQKMEAVGQLTGGIAHDFNNLLTTIMASLEMLEQHGGLDARGHRMAGNALEGARRAARLTSQLLSFSRRSRLTPEKLYPEAVLQGISELLAQSAGGRIRIALEPAGPGSWPILADRNQLEAAVLNLVINARDAITGEGRIGISIANRPLTEAEARSVGPDPVPGGDYVGVTVSDTGSGMTPDVLTHALEPFFTTKAVGSGTGLGLSQTYGFVAQSGGTLRIHTAPGAGTSVEILLPRAVAGGPVQGGVQGGAQGGARGAAEASAACAAEGEVILLAEDDALLRHTVGEVLREQGYVVKAAANGQAALALLESLERVDLLLTEVVMPGGMNGMELAAAARRMLPDLPIMFTTGYSNQRVLAPWPEPADIVAKPFDVHDLAARVTSRLRVGEQAVRAGAAVIAVGSQASDPVA